MTWGGVSVLSKPAALPLAVADLKARLRVDHADEDLEIEGFLRAAVAMIDGPEGIGVAILRQTWRLTLDILPAQVILPGAPIAGLVALRVLGAGGTWQEVPPEDCRLVAGIDPVRLVPAPGVSWPRPAAQPGAVQIDYTLGAATPAEADPALVTAVALIAGQYYNHRAAIMEGQAVELPLGARHIMEGRRRGLVG
ncbi:head-tail connector protein [Sulfitobacter indolifex]|uniref:head-tail connector protein n=1 Tax=Sulfitobacter indolifex TaxID=225422 RepID=UPI0010541179|nr:hypothetical protein [Sulfitobacter indolifex]